MKLFVLEQLQQDDDITFYKIMAEGVEFDDGRICMQWQGDVKSIVFHDNIDNLQKISCFPSREITRRIRYLN